jgi:hypothetical protein
MVSDCRSSASHNISTIGARLAANISGLKIRRIVRSDTAFNLARLYFAAADSILMVKTHSSRSAFIGSIAAARRAGPKVAASVTTTSRAGTTT